MSLKDIREYINLALQGDETIEQRLELFYKQREILQAQMAELQETLDTLDYKCWYYETAKEAGSTHAPETMPLEKSLPNTAKPADGFTMRTEYIL